MPLNINIRRATLSDLDTLVAFNIAMAQETEERELPVESITNGVRAMLEDDSLGPYFVAELEGTPVGQLMFTTEWSEWHNGHFWWLQTIYVRPEFRRQGVLRQLYTFLQQLARAEGNVRGLRLYVERTNHTAKLAYENLGMQHSHYDLYEMLFPE